MDHHRTWLADSVNLEEEARGDLLQPFCLQLEQKAHRRYQLLDTFDWSIWQQGEILLYNQTQGEGRSYELWQRGDFFSGTPSQVVPHSGQKHRFWWEFTSLAGSGLQKQLKRSCKLRALLELHPFELDQLRYAVKNEDQKSVAWLEQITLHGKSENQGVRRVLRLVPVRGYERELKKLQKKIQQAGFPLYDGALLEEHLIDSEKFPAQYQSKPSIVITEEDPVREVVLRYMRSLLSVSRENETGIIEDLDIEFLHDYRVSLRRIRSIISLVSKIFSVEETRWLKKEFAAIGKKTNLLRDLDVYLLEQENYRALVPPVLSGGVDELFESLTLDRKRELSRVRRWLRSAGYRKRLEYMQQRLTGTAETLGTGVRSEQPVLQVASLEISKKFHKIGKLGNKIDSSTSDEEVHDLRLECKKLRYLLEFFGGLFAKKSLNKAVSVLKKLQDNLGRFNDLSVQQESLERFLQDHQQQQSTLSAAVGGLISALSREQREERMRVTENFALFYSPENRQLYAQMVDAGLVNKEVGKSASKGEQA